MRNTKWLRYGLASTGIACGALAAVLAACGDDDSGVTAAVDGGRDGNVTPGDTGTPDTNAPDTNQPDTGPPVVPAKVVMVHAATDYGPGNPEGVVRICYATKSATSTDFAVAALPPLPHSIQDGGVSPYPGIPIGTGGPFPSTGVPLESVAIRPYLISARALADRGIVGTTGAAVTSRCPSLIAGEVPDGGFPDGGSDAGLQANRDYWQLADIPAGTLKNGKTYMLAVYGCTNDANGTTFANKCGPNSNGTGQFAPDGGAGPGNLKIVVLELDATTTVGANEIGIQVVNLSPQHATARAALPGAIPNFSPIMIVDRDAGDAGVRYVSPDGGEQEVPFNANPTATAMAKITGLITNKGFFAANEEGAATSPTTPFVLMPMNNSAGTPPGTIQFLSEGRPNTQDLYVNGKTYTFVLVGDINTSFAGTSRFIHFLGFPNVFTPPPVQ